MTMQPDELPLFPLSAVLLPGRSMDLRIFERRYIDMIGECGRLQCDFVICLILEGEESGARAVPASVGCQAHIEDFWTQPDGLLGIRVRGVQRVRVDEVRVRNNGLLIGRTHACVEAPPAPLPAEFGLLATLLRRLAEREDSELARAPADRFDDAAWIAWNLAAEVPLEPVERQLLLQQDDAEQRLRLLLEWLPRFTGE